jgi:predicted nucleic acid-binding protein
MKYVLDTNTLIYFFKGLGREFERVDGLRVEDWH